LSSDYVTIEAETIWASLKEQPSNKPITLERLLSEEDGIPSGLGELFSQIANRLCSLTQEETTFLSEPSEGRSQTQPSPTSASAKNSAGRQTNSHGNQQKQYSSSS